MRIPSTCLRFVLVLVLAALAAAVAPARAQPSAQLTQVRILAEWPGDVEQEDFEALLLPFLQDFDVQPVLVSATNLEETLRQQIDAGTPPDLVIMTQPGLLAGYARTAQVIDLGAALGPAASGYPAYLDQALSVDGRVYGRAIRLVAKALVWYPADDPILAGAGIPATWDDLLALGQQIAGTGATPWSISLSATTGTDIIETLLYQRYGAGLIDGLAAGQVAWTDERVRDAWTSFGQLLAPGTVESPAALAPVAAAVAPFDASPDAALSIASSTAAAWIPAASRQRPGEDFLFFPLPAGDPQRVIVGADFVVLFNDNPITTQLAGFLTAPETTAAWAAAGSAISPYPVSGYPNPALDALAALVHDGEPLFDLSDRLAPAVRQAFVVGTVRYAAEPDALPDILAGIEAAG